MNREQRHEVTREWYSRLTFDQLLAMDDKRLRQTVKRMTLDEAGRILKEGTTKYGDVAGDGEKKMSHTELRIAFTYGCLLNHAKKFFNE